MPIIEGWIGGSVDVAVIGAGAAGLAAARHLLIHGDHSVLVIEAGTRLGGRAYTLAPPSLGLPLDLGCGWLHGAKTNAWTPIAEEHGFTVDRHPAPWDDPDRKRGLSPEERDGSERAFAAFYEKVVATAGSGRDCALADLVEPETLWAGLLGAVSTYVSGAELDKVSCVDLERYRPGEGPDWRIAEGYGRLIATYGAIVPVVLDAQATRIDHSAADAVRVDTSRGLLTARAVVVTVSTDVLAAEKIRFTPPRPEKIDAAANLPLGLANKLFLRVSRPEDLPVDGYVLGSPYRTATGAYHLQPFGRPLVEAFYGGQLARDLERQGEAGMAAFAAEELVGHFGASIRSRLVPVCASAWASEPHFGGSYAYAKPGAANCRGILAAPIENRIFFAGEACSPQKFTTAHGAYETGVAAAEAALVSLSPSIRARGA